MINVFTLQNKNGNRCRYSQESTFHEIDDRNINFNLSFMTKLPPNNLTNSKKSSCKIFRQDNTVAALKKKSINKRPRPVCRSVQKFPAKNKIHRDTKVSSPKKAFIAKNSLLKKKALASTYKKKTSNVKPKFSKKFQKTEKIKIEKIAKIKLPLNTSGKKSVAMIKKNLKKKRLPALKPNSLKKPFKEGNRFTKKNNFEDASTSRKDHKTNINFENKDKSKLIKLDRQRKKKMCSCQKNRTIRSNVS